MILKFKKVILHNFLSYGHAEINLLDRHYCLVKGINKCKSDNAASNGSGKSTWSSAICWALTGETIQGLSSNVKNINIDENICYVQVEFLADNDEFIICRHKNPKSDLKIFLNGSDISGKGIRESEEILARYLPDLTSQLIASIIILGQGLPNKFTNNSPSGRKEVLEKLSKSDFMIQDLKSRISVRQDELSKQLRVKEDTILATSTKIDVLNDVIERTRKALDELKTYTEFDILIVELEKKICALNITISDIDKKCKNNSDLDLKYVEEYVERLSIRDKEVLEENIDFDVFKSEYLDRRTQILSQIQSINSRIQEKQSIKDICPTCGQKIPNVVKPDISADLIALDAVKIGLSELDEKFKSAETQHTLMLSEINNKHSKKLHELVEISKNLKDTIRDGNSEIQKLQNESLTLQTELAKITLDKNECNNKRKNLEDTLSQDQVELNTQIDVKKLLESDRDNITEHIKVINQLNTAIKRDFRGYLLSEIIDFIEAKSKEYCQYVFGNSDIEFKLNGNNIEINYCSKSFENLSGGEKQRIDLILQFAIRNMMEYYLNFSSNIIVLDEIFDQLDTIGCQNILNLINKNLSDVESIYIISHRAEELEIPYDYILTITKNEEGVSSVEYNI